MAVGPHLQYLGSFPRDVGQSLPFDSGSSLVLASSNLFFFSSLDFVPFAAVYDTGFLNFWIISFYFPRCAGHFARVNQRRPVIASTSSALGSMSVLPLTEWSWNSGSWNVHGLILVNEFHVIELSAALIFTNPLVRVKNEVDKVRWRWDRTCIT
jgi:hypothetical protein